MRYTITIIILILILIYQYNKAKSFLSMAVLYPVLWIMALAGLGLSDIYYVVSYRTLAIIVLGYILFCVAFNFQNKKNRQEGIATAVFSDSHVNMFGLNIVFYIALVIGLLYLIRIWRYVSIFDISKSLIEIRSNQQSGTIRIPMILTYLSIFVRCTLWFYLLLFFRARENTSIKMKSKRHMLRVRSIILSVLCFAILLTNFSRNSLLFLVLPICFIAIICGKTSNAKIVICSSIFGFLFLGIFIWFSTIKSAYLFEGKDFWTVAFNNISLYLSGGIVGFDQSLDSILKIFTLNGENGRYTCSLLMAFCDILAGTNLTPATVQNNIKIGSNIYTNVYTVYHWTSMDFGVIYSLVLQLFYGALYGYLYRKVRCGKLLSTFWYSVLSYPLVMMFFQDQYFSIGQSWFILFFATVVISVLCGVSRLKLYR